MAWDLLGIQGNIESAGVSALKSPAVQEAGRTFLVDMFSRITSQDALYSGKANDIANISKNLTNDDIQGLDFTNKDTWKNSLVNILQNKGLFNDDFTISSVENIIDSSIAKTVADNLKSHSINIEQDTMQPNNIYSINKIKNILQDIQSELLKQNAPVSDGLNNLLDAQIALHKDKLENIAKNAGENVYAHVKDLLGTDKNQETKANQVDTHLKNAIDKIKNISDEDVKIISDDIRSADIGRVPYARTDIVIALINQSDVKEFSDADKKILTQSIQDKIVNDTEIQPAEITRDDMIDIITDFKDKLLTANAPVTAQARALIDANTEYAQEKMKTVMQGALFDIAGITAEQAQGKTPIEAVKGAVKEQIRGTVFEELGLTQVEQEKATRNNTPLAQLVKDKAKQAVTDSQADIGKTIINGVFQAVGNGLSNIVPTIFNHTVAPVAKAVGMEKPLNDGIEKIHNFAKNNPKMALAGKLGGGLAGVLLATKLFSMGLGTFFSPTPPPPPPKTVTDFLWNNSPWIAPMAIPPAMSFIGSLWNNMFGRTNHQAQMPAMYPQYMPHPNMQQNTTPEPQSESPLTAMDAMMAIFANGLGKIHGG